MKIECFEKFDIITPEAGMMLTNEEIVSDKLYTPCNADLSAWREVTKEEADKIQAEQEAKALEEENTLEV